MSRILHLSDLHLGNSVEEDQVGDYKIEAIDERDRATRVRLIHSTLKGLGKRLEKNGQALDAVVITGDVTTQGREEGFGHLADVIACLGDTAPDPDQIVVVPGNHDVKWATEAGTKLRYKYFLDHVRKQGYVTPYLDGIDFEVDRLKGSRKPVRVEGSDFVVVAVNSADMCGVREPFPPALASEYDRLVAAGTISPELAKEIERKRLYDMPRLSYRQMDALGDVLAPYKEKHKVVIAAMHHHLMPVDETEEAKPFESFVNLGAVLSFLGTSHVDVVLHGHKHVSGARLLPLLGDHGPYEALVASCGTVGGTTGAGNEIAKLIEVNSELPTLRQVTITSVLAITSSSGALPNRYLEPVRTERVRRLNRPHPNVVAGPTAVEVHEELMEIGRERDREVGLLLCRIEDGQTAATMPDSYPPLDGVTDDENWFDTIVNWWQDAQFAPGKPFTHGQRLKNYRREVDQLEAIVQQLSQSLDTSRGVAVLIDPERDTAVRAGQDSTVDVEFPSFCLVHFHVRNNKVDCTAHFRKQEMRYWWPINVAELARLQAEVVRGLNRDTLSTGAITTYTSMAVFSNKLPRVNVPEVDREAWRDEDALRALAISVVEPRLPKHAAHVAKLRGLVLGWMPEGPDEPTDGFAVPVHGIRVIATFLEAAADVHSGRQDNVNPLVHALHRIDEANREYIRARATERAGTGHAFKALLTKLQRERTEIEEVLGPADT